MKHYNIKKLVIALRKSSGQDFAGDFVFESLIKNNIQYTLLKCNPKVMKYEAASTTINSGWEINNVINLWTQLDSGERLCMIINGITVDQFKDTILRTLKLKAFL